MGWLRPLACLGTAMCPVGGAGQGPQVGKTQVTPLSITGCLERAEPRVQLQPSVLHALRDLGHFAAKNLAVTVSWWL